jgi:CubicO group peptidase (beta-lactamase class C family)
MGLNEALRETTVAAMERLRVPGVAVGVLQAGEESGEGFGVTSVENPLSVDGTTLFQIGSITKTFTATAVMRLVEQGKLALDVPVRTYLPELRLAVEDVAARVTLRHALTHVGGWPGDLFEDQGPGDDAIRLMVGKMAGLPQLTALGEVWSYNNVAFNLAGRAIEVVTGQSFERAIQSLLLDPLGMDRTFFCAVDAISYRCAVGHVSFDEGPRVSRPWTVGRSTHPFAGMISCTRDLLRWARFHLSDGTTPDGNLVLETVRRGNLLGTKPEAPPSPPVRLAFRAKDAVVALDPPAKGNRGEFIRDTAGNIAWVRWGGRIHGRVGETPSP